MRRLPVKLALVKVQFDTGGPSITCQVVRRVGGAKCRDEFYGV